MRYYPHYTISRTAWGDWTVNPGGHRFRTKWEALQRMRELNRLSKKRYMEFQQKVARIRELKRGKPKEEEKERGFERQRHYVKPWKHWFMRKIERHRRRRIYEEVRREELS